MSDGKGPTIDAPAVATRRSSKKPCGSLQNGKDHTVIRLLYSATLGRRRMHIQHWPIQNALRIDSFGGDLHWPGLIGFRLSIDGLRTLRSSTAAHGSKEHTCRRYAERKNSATVPLAERSDASSHSGPLPTGRRSAERSASAVCRTHGLRRFALRGRGSLTQPPCPCRRRLSHSPPQQPQMHPRRK